MTNPFFSSALAAAKQGPDAFAAEFEKKEANANVKEYDDCGDPLIHSLIKEEGDILDADLPALLAILVQHQVDFSVRNQADQMPLATAASWLRKDAVNFLIEHKAEINDTIRPALCSVVGGVDGNDLLRLDIMKTLVQHGANVNIQDTHGNSPLMLAARESRLEVMRYLLAQGANLFLRSNRNRTALTEAHSSYISARNVFAEDDPFVINDKNCLDLLIQAAIVFLYRRAATFTGNEAELKKCLNKDISDLAGNYQEAPYAVEANSIKLKEMLIEKVYHPVLKRIKAEYARLHSFWAGSRAPGSGMYQFFQQTNGFDLVPLIFSFVHQVTPQMIQGSKKADEASSSSNTMTMRLSK